MTTKAYLDWLFVIATVTDRQSISSGTKLACTLLATYLAVGLAFVSHAKQSRAPPSLSAVAGNAKRLPSGRSCEFLLFSVIPHSFPHSSQCVLPA